VLAVDEHRPPEDLRHLRVTAGGEELGRLEAVLRALGADLELHQLVVAERLVELAQHRLGDALLPHLHDG
jgi:hypothetical protein